MAELNKEQLEARDKARLIKKAVKIVDELADMDIDEMEGSENFDDLRFLIEDAEKLKKDRNWKL